MSHAHLIKIDDIESGGLIKVGRAAKALDVSVKTVYAWIYQGKLNALNVQGNIRIEAAYFLRWVDIHAKKVSAN